MSFETLLADIKAAQLLKSQADAGPVGGDGKKDDKQIAAAAAAAAGAGEGAGGGEGGGDPEPDEDDMMGKSFAVQLQDGSTMQAIDGTAVLKSLTAKTTEMSTSLAALTQAHIQTEQGTLAALGEAVTLIKSLTADVVALKTQVAGLGGTGRGRQAVVTVAERPTTETLAKSMQPGAQGQPQGLTGEQFMGKCMDMLGKGMLTSLDVAVAEGYINKGQPVPEGLRNKVLSATV